MHASSLHCLHSSNYTCLTIFCQPYSSTKREDREEGGGGFPILLFDKKMVAYFFKIFNDLPPDLTIIRKRLFLVSLDDDYLLQLINNVKF